MNQLITQDCVAGMKEVGTGLVKLGFADPPYNIGFDYDDEYDDSLTPDRYEEWSCEWMVEMRRVLADDGSFWLTIGDEWVADLRVLARKLGFHLRSWVIWYYTFGVNCTQKLTRSHAHLLYFTKHKKKFTFNADAVRIPSARALVYNDARANPEGRLPDDTWILRPQELDAQAFPEFSDTWHIPRVAGTFKQRVAGAPNQMPEQLLGRIIRLCSNPGDLVLDPFAGSATTLVVAKKLGRQYLGYELSKRFAAAGQKRIDAARAGDPLDGLLPQGSPNVQATPTGQAAPGGAAGPVPNGPRKRRG